jgi:predicted alpha/beta-hydrolase family hydrolase
MLFLQGTRDDLADLDLIKQVTKKLPRATLHVVDHADHGFGVLKRSGRTAADVLKELAKAMRGFI